MIDCPSGKIRYKNARDAWRALQRIRRLKDKRNRHESHVYQCRWCQGWHLSSGTMKK